MAITALHTAATGLAALNTQLDVTANNLANANTIGFKSTRVNFADLLYMQRVQPGLENAIGDVSPIGLHVGLGTRVVGTQLDFKQGNLISTQQPLDVAVEGLGFLRFTVPPDRATGGVAYSRTGSLTKNADGELVMAGDQGMRLDPVITIPADAITVNIGTDGRVFVLQPGAAEPTEVGQIELTTFVNPAGLKPLGDNLYGETAASGPAITGNPEEENRGSIRAGLLEGSNVDPTAELIELIKTQRAFEMNSQTIRTADEALRTVAQIKR